MQITSKRILLSEAMADYPVRRPVQLVHITAGTELAGAGTRQTNECFAVETTIDGSRHARRYKTRGEAEAVYNQHFNRHKAARN